MMTPASRESLDADPETLVFEPRRGTVRIHGVRVPSLLNRCGVSRRQWDHLTCCWMAPIAYMPALLERAENDRRDILIDDWAELDPPAPGDAA
jgi:hypothetical protein